MSRRTNGPQHFSRKAWLILLVVGIAFGGVLWCHRLRHHLQNDHDCCEPDTDDGGYEFWLTKLNQFGGDFQVAEMVKAFILSGEYRSRFGQP